MVGLAEADAVAVHELDADVGQVDGDVIEAAGEADADAVLAVTGPPMSVPWKAQPVG